MVKNIVDIIHKNKGKVIANEVTTGIARTGKWFGFQHYGIQPDMIAMGKGIGNGYPVSVAAINQETITELEEKTFKYMQSHQNDPLGAVVVKEVIQAIKEDGMIEKTYGKGKRFLEQLQSLVDHQNILAVRSRGLMFGVDFKDIETGNKIFNHLLEKGFIVRNRKGLFRIDPPLTITVKEFDLFISAFLEILEEFSSTNKS